MPPRAAKSPVRSRKTSEEEKGRGRTKSPAPRRRADKSPVPRRPAGDRAPALPTKAGAPEAAEEAEEVPSSVPAVEPQDAESYEPVTTAANASEAPSSTPAQPGSNTVVKKDKPSPLKYEKTLNIAAGTLLVALAVAVLSLILFYKPPAPLGAPATGSAVPSPPPYKPAPGEVANYGPKLFTDEKTLKKKGSVLLMFMAPWCGHCKALKPEFKEAAAEVASQGIRLAQVDCDKYKDLCQSFDVQGYPTVKLFKNGKFITDFDGERDKAGILKWLDENVSPSVAKA